MAPQDHSLLVLFDERIIDLITYLRWYDRLSPVLRVAMAPVVKEYKQELRALLRLRSKAKRASRQAEIERTRAIDARVDRVLDAIEGPWDRESDPAWNGAYDRW